MHQGPFRDFLRYNANLRTIRHCSCIPMSACIIKWVRRDERAQIRRLKRRTEIESNLGLCAKKTEPLFVVFEGSIGSGANGAAQIVTVFGYWIRF
jgi:hypothetical protein